MEYVCCSHRHVLEPCPNSLSIGVLSRKWHQLEVWPPGRFFISVYTGGSSLGSTFDPYWWSTYRWNGGTQSSWTIVRHTGYRAIKSVFDLDLWAGSTNMLKVATWEDVIFNLFNCGKLIGEQYWARDSEPQIISFGGVDFVGWCRTCGWVIHEVSLVDGYLRSKKLAGRNALGTWSVFFQSNGEKNFVQAWSVGSSHELPCGRQDNGINPIWEKWHMGQGVYNAKRDHSL